MSTTQVTAGHLYTFNIEKMRDDKVAITILSARCKDREFDILIDADGLKITIDGEMHIQPRASNQVRIDYLE